MKSLFFPLLMLIIIIGCASSNNNEEDEQNSYPHLVNLEQSKDQPSKISKVYIDSVTQVTAKEQPALLISGTFPDACTKLEEVSHRTKNDSLIINISAWRNPEEMCAQVLTPFSYIYSDIKRETLSNYSSVTINNTSYTF